MPIIVTTTRVRIIVPRERIESLTSLLVAQFEMQDTYLVQKEKYQGALNTFSPDQLLFWLLGMMEWRANALPNGDVIIIRYNGDVLDLDNDPFLLCAKSIAEEGSYIEGFTDENQQWQLMYTGNENVKRTTAAIFPHFQPKLRNGTTLDIVTESNFWRSVELAALWYLRLSEKEQAKALEDYEDENDLQQQVCHAVSDAMIPDELKDYVAVIQVLPDVWNVCYPDAILEDDESPTLEHIFDITLRNLIHEHLKERWEALELEAPQA